MICRCCLPFRGLSSLFLDGVLRVPPTSALPLAWTSSPFWPSSSSSFSSAVWAFALFWGYRNWLFPALWAFSPCVPNGLSPSQQPDLHPDCGCPWVWRFLRLCAKRWPQPHARSTDKEREDHHTLGIDCILSALLAQSHCIPGKCPRCLYFYTLWMNRASI